MNYIENIVIGRPISSPESMFSTDDKDWKNNESEKTYYTEERFLPRILVDIGVYPSVSEIRRNKSELMINLDKVDFIDKLKVKKNDGFGYWLVRMENNIMKPIVLVNEDWSQYQYYCEITKILDDNWIQESRLRNHRNYIYDSRQYGFENLLVIRVPGMTTGYIKVDNNNIIIECKIEKYALKDSWCHYADDVNEKLKQFVGRQIVFNK